MGMRISYDAERLEDTGWGLITSGKSDPALLDEVRGRLGSLLELRKKYSYERYKELSYQPGETAAAFMAQS